MKNYILKTNDFTLEFELKVFDKDVNIPTNFILNIKINSDNFGAITTMDIDIKMFQKFAKELFDVYTTLKGGYEQELKFENEFDQTYLKDFVTEINQ